VLTWIGEREFAQARQIDLMLANIEPLIEKRQGEVKGCRRVTCPRPQGQRYLVPMLV